MPIPVMNEPSEKLIIIEGDASNAAADSEARRIDPDSPALISLAVQSRREIQARKSEAWARFPMSRCKSEAKKTANDPETRLKTKDARAAQCV
jgi:hypothetical protein